MNVKRLIGFCIMILLVFSVFVNAQRAPSSEGGQEDYELRDSDFDGFRGMKTEILESEGNRIFHSRLTGPLGTEERFFNELGNLILKQRKFLDGRTHSSVDYLYGADGNIESVQGEYFTYLGKESAGKEIVDWGFVSGTNDWRLQQSEAYSDDGDLVYTTKFTYLSDGGKVFEEIYPDKRTRYEIDDEGKTVEINYYDDQDREIERVAFFNGERIGTLEFVYGLDGSIKVIAKDRDGKISGEQTVGDESQISFAVDELMKKLNFEGFLIEEFEKGAGEEEYEDVKGRTIPTYDEFGRKIGDTVYDNDGNAITVISYKYDEDGNLINEIILREGEPIEYITYNKDGTKTTDYLEGDVTKVDNIESLNKLKREVTDASGNLIRVEYFAEGRISKGVTFGKDGTIKIETYGADGKVIDGVTKTFTRVDEVDDFVLVKDKDGKHVILSMEAMTGEEFKEPALALPTKFKIGTEDRDAISAQDYFTLVKSGVLEGFVGTDGKVFNVGFNAQSNIYYVPGTGELAGKARIVGFRVDLGSGRWSYARHESGPTNYNNELYNQLKAAGLIDDDLTYPQWLESRTFDPETGEPEGIWIGSDGYVVKDDKYLVDVVYHDGEILSTCPGLGLGYEVWCKGDTFVRRVAGKLEKVEFEGFEEFIDEDKPSQEEIAEFINERRKVQDFAATVLQGPRTALGQGFSDWFNAELTGWQRTMNNFFFADDARKWFFQPEKWEEMLCEQSSLKNRPQFAQFGFTSDGETDITIMLQAEKEDFVTGYNESTGDKVEETLYQVSWMVKNVQEDGMLYTVCANRCDSSCVLVSQTYTDRQVSSNSQDSGFRAFYYPPGIKTMALCYVYVNEQGQQVGRLNAWTVPVVSENYQPSDSPLYGETPGGAAPQQTSTPRGAGGAITP